MFGGELWILMRETDTIRRTHRNKNFKILKHYDLLFFKGEAPLTSLIELWMLPSTVVFVLVLVARVLARLLWKQIQKEIVVERKQLYRAKK